MKEFTTLEDFEKTEYNAAVIYKDKNYTGPIAFDVKPSQELDEYHKNSCIQVNLDGKTILKKVGNI